MPLTFVRLGESAYIQDATEVKQLLAESELPYEDITAAHLEHFWAARDGGRLVGVAGLELLGSFGLLRSLAVPIEYRGRGIAPQLVVHVEEYARAQGIQTLYLLTTTAEDFFTKHGYKKTSRDTVPSALQKTTEFQSLCPASAVCLVKQL